MSAFEIKSECVISDEHTLRGMFPATHELAALKCQSMLDRHAQDFIGRSPFLCIGTQDEHGHADVSPRGDPPGFVQILDPRRLAIPDRPGNNRLDSLVNIIANPSVGLLFIIPGYDETLRVSGQARLVNDPDLLARMAVNGRVPTVAIVVEIEEAFLHCAKAFRRAHLWEPAHFQDRSEMPSLMNMLLDQTTGAPEEDGELDRLDAGLEQDYKTSMY